LGRFQFKVQRSKFKVVEGGALEKDFRDTGCGLCKWGFGRNDSTAEHDDSLFLVREGG
jgi:hypothetical protein